MERMTLTGTGEWNRKENYSNAHQREERSMVPDRNKGRVSLKVVPTSSMFSEKKKPKRSKWCSVAFRVDKKHVMEGVLANKRGFQWM